MSPEKKPPSASVARLTAGRWQSSPHRGLSWALGLSVAVHAGLVGFRFAAPEAYNRVFQDTPLEVILVNARSEERPQEAQALAQVRLAGGGEVPQVRTTTLPCSSAPRGTLSCGRLGTSCSMVCSSV